MGCFKLNRRKQKIQLSVIPGNPSAPPIGLQPVEKPGQKQSNTQPGTPFPSEFRNVQILSGECNGQFSIFVARKLCLNRVAVPPDGTLISLLQSPENVLPLRRSPIICRTRALHVIFAWSVPVWLGLTLASLGIGFPGCHAPEGHTHGRPSTQSENTTAHHVSAESGTADTLAYRLYPPAEAGKQPTRAGTRYPLVVFFHGYGQQVLVSQPERAQGFGVFVRDSSQAQYPCYVFTPQCPEGQRWVDTDWRLPAHRTPPKPSFWMASSIQRIESLIDRYPIDTQRIYITGLSMGGFATWDYASRMPHRPAALVPVCGGGDTARSVVSTLAHIPSWIFHGAKDPVVDAARSRTMVASLQNVGAQPKYTEYPSLEHNSWSAAYSEPGLLPWLFAQQRSEAR